MKTFKKNKLGVIVLALLLFGVLCFSISGKALADTSYIPRSENQIKNVSLKFGSDRSTIIATFPAEGSVRSGFIILTDNDPTDAIFNYKPPSGYCSAGNNGGITFGKNGAGTIDAAPGSFGAPIKAYVDLDYLPAASASNGACVDTKNGPASSGNYLIAVTNASVLNQELQWQADGSLTPLAPLQPGVSGITSYKSYSFAPTALDNILRFDGDQGRSSCPDVAVVASNNQSADIYYLVNSVGKNQVDAFTITALKGIVTSADSCGVLAVNYSANNPTATQIRSAATYGINGSRPTPPSQGGAGATTPVAGARGSVPDTCEGASNGFSFAWLACPLVGAGQEISDSLINAFEGELSFNVNQSLGNKKSQASVQQTWSLVRNLATAFLVVLMLVMVISQAVGGGPFDAYTVRKMLPRLVAVAIAIQLSWPLVSWVIDTFDDLGRGIADIMYFSFGGADSLSLGQILANAHIGTSTTETISWEE